MLGLCFCGHSQKAHLYGGCLGGSGTCDCRGTDTSMMDAAVELWQRWFGSVPTVPLSPEALLKAAELPSWS